MNWLISANSEIYDHASSFEHYGQIDWRQNQTRYTVGDTVYIYCTKPLQKIRYKCQVVKTGMSFGETRDDKEYWLDLSEYQKALGGSFVRLKLVSQIDTKKLSLNELKLNGLTAAPQGPVRLNGNILDYIQKIFALGKDDFFPETVPLDLEVFEGLKQSIMVNRYERSSIARSMCIKHNGCACKICGFDFEKIYGEIGKNFIHVHHLVPLREITQEYKIDYKTHLLPVCPNCHAMLHRKFEGMEPTPQQLKVFIGKNAS